MAAQGASFSRDETIICCRKRINGLLPGADAPDVYSRCWNPPTGCPAFGRARRTERGKCWFFPGVLILRLEGTSHDQLIRQYQVDEVVVS
jgi:hypothetical protein